MRLTPTTKATRRWLPSGERPSVLPSRRASSLPQLLLPVSKTAGAIRARSSTETRKQLEEAHNLQAVGMMESTFIRALLKGPDILSLLPRRPHSGWPPLLLGTGLMISSNMGVLLLGDDPIRYIRTEVQRRGTPHQVLSLSRMHVSHVAYDGQI